MVSKKLPVGIENFEEMRKEDFYYVDKTGLIIDLMNGWSKVNLFTRPRRFGKTMAMSMLAALTAFLFQQYDFFIGKRTGNRI